MNFLNPPVAELWVSFSFAPNEAKTGWDLGQVGKFLQRYMDEFPRLERALETELHVEETSASDLPRVIGRDVRVKYVRASNADRSRILQLADDELAFHLLKRGDNYPRFSAVREAITPKLNDYLRDFQPASIRKAVIHYLDIIDIPIPVEGKIEIRDYFPFVTDLPELPFGQVQFTAQQFVAECPVDEGPLHLQIRTLQSPPEKRVFRFRVDWQKHSTNVNSLDLANIWNRLDRSHHYLRDCFEHFLTKSTLDLFGPFSEH